MEEDQTKIFGNPLDYGMTQGYRERPGYTFKWLPKSLGRVNGIDNSQANVVCQMIDIALDCDTLEEFRSKLKETQ